MLALRRPSALLPCSFAVLLAAGCGPEDGSDLDGTTGADGTGGTSTIADGDGGIPLSVNRDVDVLLVIDNSSSMGEEQALLAAALESLVGVLERPDVGANYRIGITTTDDGNPWCDGTTPEAGALRLTSCRSRPAEFVFDGAETTDVTQEACFDLCPEQWTDIEILPTALTPGQEAAPRNWLESVEGLTNLPEGLTVAQALRCLAPQGINGCGFESPLESMWKALRRSTTEDDADFGFVRAGAVLSVVHVTDEVDCSYNDDWESIFLPTGNRVFWSDDTAPAPTSAVCWNAGVLCSGSGTYDACASANFDVDGAEVGDADAPELAVLRPLSRYVDLLQELENAKQQLIPDQEVLVAVLGGVGADGTVTYQDSDSTFQSDFGIGPGCVGSNGSAVPPVRLRELAEAFQVGDERNLFSICDDDYRPALEAIAESIAARLLPACMPACVADTDPTTPEVVDPQCTLIQHTPLDDGTVEEISVPPCSGGAVPEGEDVCYQTRVGAALSPFCAEQGFNLEFQLIHRPGEPTPPGSVIVPSCTLSQDKAVDCPLLP